MRVVGVIPARGGSKGVHRKNIALVAGKPLLQYTAEAALSAKLLTRVLVSTDDDEIASVATACGVEVPFRRPDDLATDATPTLPVLQHAVRWLEEREEPYDAVCLLQPTNPLRRAAHIDGCIGLLEKISADSVMTILPVPHQYNPHWVYYIDSSGALCLSTGEREPVTRRQNLPPAFHREGSVYVTRRDVLMNGNSLYGSKVAGYPMTPDESVNIDGTEDLMRAEVLLEARQRAAAAGIVN